MTCKLIIKEQNQPVCCATDVTVKRWPVQITIDITKSISRELGEWWVGCTTILIQSCK
jgi:hypothetical protein